MNMQHFQPKDIIAILVLVSVVFLLFNNIESPLPEVAVGMLGFYFGLRKNKDDTGI
mgnify:CR=1 FL=1